MAHQQAAENVHVDERDPLAPPQAPAKGFMSLTLVGSGVSTALPVIGHMGEENSCACADAIRHPTGPNCRNNVSLLITVPTTPTASDDAPAASAVPSTTETSAETHKKPSHDNFTMPTVNTMHGAPVRCVLIDCGKTFRSAYFRVLVRHHVRIIDALFLTHDHADAVAGLDDMRDVQAMHMDAPSGEWYIDQFIPTYVTPTTLRSLEQSVGYILRNSHLIGAAPDTASRYQSVLDAAKTRSCSEQSGRAWNNIGIRRSTALEVFTVPEEGPARVYVPALQSLPSASSCQSQAQASDFPFYTVPVEHGKGYISLGFVFGYGTAFRSQGSTAEEVLGKSCVAYISDVTDFPTASMQFMQDLVKIDVLYVDMLHGPGRYSNVHYSMDEVAELVLRLKPRRVFCIGMYCDVEHERGNAMWRERLAEYLADGKLVAGEVERVTLGYDGMELVLPQ